MRILNGSECTEIAGGNVTVSVVSPNWTLVTAGSGDTFTYKNNNDVFQINGKDGYTINGQTIDNGALENGILVNNIKASYVEIGHILSDKVYSFYAY